MADSVIMAGMQWLRASGCEATACVEIAVEYGYVLLRNSELKLEIVRFTPEEWSLFTDGVKSGEFDRIVSGEPD
jgi:hypothetical protein